MAGFTVEEFCKYCDNGPLGFNNCSHQVKTYTPYTDQERYARRGFCGWACLEGLHVSIINEDPNYQGVKDLHIKITTTLRGDSKKIPISNLELLKKVVEGAKRKGVRVNRNLPSQSILDKLTQEINSQ